MFLWRKSIQDQNYIYSSLKQITLVYLILEGKSSLGLIEIDLPFILRSYNVLVCVSAAIRTSFVACVETTMVTLMMTSVPPAVNWSPVQQILATAGTQTLSKSLV